jgi:molybdate transport system substrate-binding protein
VTDELYNRTVLPIREGRNVHWARLISVQSMCKVRSDFIESLLMLANPKAHFCTVLLRSVLFFVAIGSTVGVAGTAHAQIVVAAAADLGPALSELSKQYQTKTAQTVRISLGSSGNLTQQIKNGAPFDVFLSADEEYPRQLISGGFAEPNSLYRYAVGKLVIWVPANSQLDLAQHGIEVLLDPAVKKIAIANPAQAPYGRAAVAALKHYGMYEKVESRLALGENVSQAAQFVESGNVQAGLVALSHALAPGMKNEGRYWELPSKAYPELDQAAVIISRSQRKKEAAAFLEFLHSPEAQAILQQFGFSLPGEKQ